MSTFDQQEFLERCLAEQIKQNQPDLLRLSRMQEEERLLNEIRSFYRANNWRL